MASSEMVASPCWQRNSQVLGLVHQFVVTVERFWSCDQACLRAKDPISLVPGGGSTMWVTVKRPSDTILRNYEGFNMSCMIGRG